MIQSYGNPKGENEMGRNYSRNNRNSNRPKDTTIEPVTVEEVSENAEPEPIKAKVANCKKVRIRENPTAEEDNVIDELEEGKTVIVLDSSNPDWTRVELAGEKRAWIMSKYLEVI